ncbi:NAD-dependent epimerase/dehydratase family protein [bacterium]|nr:NAD-dependent epimerase/dehydratase family protein [bacterium]MCI0566181.1 NAD-dependent epimerase/dehydratase family protein [bacterium]MCI0679719.1 NAD-dependent epimerase/dehydratase family protein [bacterium]
MPKSNVFITGVAGFLGSHLADRMLEKGHRVSGCDNMLGADERNVSKDVDFYRDDARDFEKMKARLKGVDILYHCAAAPHEGLSVFSPTLITAHTYNSTVGVVSAAVVADVKRVVFCSSMARYGRQGGEGGIFSEDMRPEPVDPYGIAKVASELFIQSMAEAHGFEYAIIVPHNIYGPRQKYDDPFRNVLSIMINRMLQEKQPIIYGDGMQRRNFSYIEDTVGPMEKAAFEDNVIGETINVGPDDEFITINEAAETLADILDFDLNPIYMPDRPQEVKHASCSAEKARRLLGYQTKTTFREGAEELVDWIRMRGAKPFEYHLNLEIINDRTPRTWRDRLI